MMEMKRLYLALFMVMLCSMTYAQFHTKGDGTTYTLKSLSEIEESGVEYIYSPNSICPHIYHLQKNIVIDAGDKFVMEDDVRVEFFENVMLTIEGESDFKLTSGSLFVPYDDDKASGTSIRLNNTVDVTVENLRQREFERGECRTYKNTFVFHMNSKTSVSHDKHGLELGIKEIHHVSVDIKINQAGS